ncbi:MAG: hypothetical protein WDN27_06280 [Candidatus Saccharibacteria bacterium]
MKSKTIELNGNQYDAATGSILHAAAPQAPRRTGQNIDGFFRTRATTIPTKASPASGSIATISAPTAALVTATPNRNFNHARAHTPQASQIAPVRVQSGVQHSQKLTVHRTPVNANHVKAHGTQHSQTLMRTAVQRPAPSFHKQAGTVGTLQHAVPSLIVPKQSAFALDPSRLARAQDISRSPMVAHHGAPRAIQPAIVPLAVQPVPVKPEGEVPANPPPPQPTNKPTDIFEHALASATNFVDLDAHKQHYKKHARRHVISMTAGTLALLLIATFAAYQNSPSMQLKVASLQAGVTASMPNFKAAGFAWNGVKAADGKLMVGFKGKQGNYQLAQQTTNLSSNDLIQTVGATDASGTPDYRAVQAGTTTVYRFNNTDATWVSGGTWYTVTGTGSLSDNQVKSLVQNI